MNLSQTSLTRVARYPGLRALAWVGDDLYAPRGYELFRAKIHDPRQIAWQTVAEFRPGVRRSLSATNRFTARLFRDGFHALAVLASGEIIGGIPGSIITLRPGDNEFRQTHSITRYSSSSHRYRSRREHLLGRIFHVVDTHLEQIAGAPISRWWSFQTCLSRRHWSGNSLRRMREWLHLPETAPAEDAQRQIDLAWLAQAVGLRHRSPAMRKKSAKHSSPGRTSPDFIKAPNLNSVRNHCTH